MDQFLTVAEIAELLKVNPQTVRNWIDRRELPAVPVGQRRVRVRQSDLDRFLEAGTRKPEPKPVEEPSVVVIFHVTATGPEYRRAVGPFPSREAAEAWTAENGLDGSSERCGMVVPLRRTGSSTDE